MKRFFLSCYLLLSITCYAEPSPSPLVERLVGIWAGSGKQDNNSQWTIKVTIKPNQHLIDYPSLNCGGMLELIKENSNSLVFREVLTYGINGCYNNGKTVLIQAPDNTLRYYWYHENGGKKAAAGKLVRQYSPTVPTYQKSF